MNTLERPMRKGRSQLSHEKGLLVGMKERIDLDVSKGSATKAEQHNIISESITSQKKSCYRKA